MGRRASPPARRPRACPTAWTRWPTSAGSSPGSRPHLDPRWGRWRDVVEHRAGYPVEQSRAGCGAGASQRRRARPPRATGRGGGEHAPREGAALRLDSPRGLVVLARGRHPRGGPDGRGAASTARFDGADLITHLSRHETEIFTDAGHLGRTRLFPVTYGVSHDFYVPGDGPARHRAAGGRARTAVATTRTLFEAVRGTDLVLDVVCKPENLAGLDVPDNVRLHGVVPLREYRALLQRAQVVVVPDPRPGLPDGVERRPRVGVERARAWRSRARGRCATTSPMRSTRDWSTRATSTAGARVADRAAQTILPASAARGGRASERRVEVQRPPHVDRDRRRHGRARSRAESARPGPADRRLEPLAAVGLLRPRLHAIRTNLGCAGVRQHVEDRGSARSAGSSASPA